MKLSLNTVLNSLLVACCCGQRRLMASAISFVPHSIMGEAVKQQTVILRGGTTSASEPSDPCGERLTPTSPSHQSRRVPALFHFDNETIYDHYSLCLAATEGLRRIRDRRIATEGERLRQRDHDPKVNGKILYEAEKRAAAIYVRDSSKVLKAMGMSVAEFNAIGRRVRQDEALKEKVVEQAYLYRIEAAVTLNRLPLRKEPNSVAHARSASSDKLREFGLSMIEIEALRLVQEARLKNYANADKLPGSISDPAWLPWLNSNVRKVVEAFQLQAEEVVKKHGIKPDEFNRMLEQTMASRLFRLNVQQQMRKYEDEVSHR